MGVQELQRTISVHGVPGTAGDDDNQIVLGNDHDVLAHVAQNTYDLVETDEVRDSFVMPEFVNNMIAKKLLGKKKTGWIL